MIEIRHGDALLLLRELEDESVDLVLTDPPYSSGGMFRSDRIQDTGTKYVNTSTIGRRPDFDGDHRDQRGFLAWCSVWLAECWRVTRLGGSVLCFVDWRQLPTLTDALQAGGYVWRGVVVWDKTEAARPRPGFCAQAEFVVWGSRGRVADSSPYLPGILRSGSPRDRWHQTEKPLGVCERLVELCPLGGLVLDPFAGSGTTLLAARNRGRRGLGFELNMDYVETSGRRLAQLSLEQIAAEVKIGYTFDPVNRLRQLQTGRSEPLRILGVIPNATERDEKDLHRRFRKWLVEGTREWFRVAPEILDHVAQHAYDWPYDFSAICGELLEAKLVAEKEGFEPSLATKHGAKRVGTHNADAAPGEAVA